MRGRAILPCTRHQRMVSGKTVRMKDMYGKDFVERVDHEENKRMRKLRWEGKAL